MRISNIGGNMKGALRYSTVLTSVLLINFGSSRASESVRVVPDIAGEKASLIVEAAGLSGAAVTVDFPVLGVNSVELNGSQYQEIQLPGGDKIFAGELTVEGAPAIPVMTTYLAVPDQAGIEYTFTYSGVEIIEDIDLAPTQHSALESGYSEIPFTIDNDIYSKDEFYPAALGAVADPVIMRDVRMIQITINPVQYNPARRQLRVYRNLSVDVSFNGSSVVNPKTTRFGYLSSGFYPIYKSMISNFDQLFSTAEVRRGGYLILVSDSFADTMSALADWKHRKGYSVHVASASEIDPNGNSPTQYEIFDYIQNAYDNWEDPPEYIMIVGDESGSYSLPDYPYSSYTSDHHYSMLEGTDFLPDAFVSRLSVSNMSNLRIALQKILDYETDPYMDDLGLWHRGLSVAGNVYATTPRTTVLWVRQFLMQHGFDSVDTVFSWSGIPGHPDSDPGPGPIITSMNRGLAFVSYRGWAGSSGWYNPSFNTGNLSSVQFHNKIGIMASIVCGTGNFGAGECFGEKWIRMGSSVNTYNGGPAFFGSTDPSTHTRWNNPIMTGFYWGIFEEGIYNFAAAAVRGKIQQYITFPGQSLIQQYFHTYNMLGDPELEARTKTPETIYVSHPLDFNFGEDYVEINVTDQSLNPVAGAYVTLVKESGGEDEVFSVVRTDESGDALLYFEAATGGQMAITVSGPDLIPYQSTISIMEGTMAVTRDSLVIDDDNAGFSSGNGDGIFNPGETIELSVYLKNYSPDETANGISAELISVDPDLIEVFVSQEYYGDIPPDGRVAPQTPFVVKIDPLAADGADAKLKIIATDGEDTWQSLAIVPVQAPKFVVRTVSFPGGNGRLDPGETIDMVLTLRNDGAVDAEGVTADAILSDDYASIASAFGDFGDIPVSQSSDNAGSPMVISCDAAAFEGRTLNLALHTMTASGAESIVPFSVIVGLLSSNDPIGPDAYGYYMYDNTDAGYAPTPAYEWVELAPNLGGSGTRINYGSNTDDNTVIITLPFDFVYYGDSYTDIAVSTNGFIAMDTSAYDMGGTHWSNFFNWPIPDPGNGRGQISPFWDDLGYSGSTYGVFTWHDADNNRFLIEWYHLSHRNTSAIETFELILTDPAHYPTLTGDSEIIYQYSAIVNNDGGENYASVGFESFDEFRGIQYSYNNTNAPGAASVSNGRAIKITTNTGRGAIAGNVDLSNGGFNQGVTVSTSSEQHRITPQTGDYWIREVPEGMTDIMAYSDGYFPAIVSEVDVVADMTASGIDFNLAICPQPANLSASEALGDHIQLTWDAVVHDDLVGYDVHRAQWENAEFEKLNAEPIADITYSDSNVPGSGLYWYYVTAVFAGDFGDAESFGSNKDSGSLDDPTGVNDDQPSIPGEFFIAQNYPNPFNPATNLSYGLAADSDVRIEVFNILGQNVRTLVDERQTAGYKSVIWDGQDDAGKRVASGVYFYTIEAGGFHESRKMLLVK